MSAPTTPVALLMAGLFRELAHAVISARTMFLTREYPEIYFALCGCPCLRVEGDHPWTQWPQCPDCAAIWDQLAREAAARIAASGGSDDDA